VNACAPQWQLPCHVSPVVGASEAIGDWEEEGDMNSSSDIVPSKDLFESVKVVVFKLNTFLPALNIYSDTAQRPPWRWRQIYRPSTSEG
jgi:hypothetical protein